MIATDSNYSPVRKSNYIVDNTRVGHDSKFDKLTLEVWTNGSILPQEAVVWAARLLIEHLNKFLSLAEITQDINIEKEVETVEENKYENITIEDLDLSVRSYNCLSSLTTEIVRSYSSTNCRGWTHPDQVSCLPSRISLTDGAVAEIT